MVSTNHRECLWLLPVVASAGVLLAVACAGDDAPPPGPTPPPAATPTPVPADPDLGGFYHRNGQYEEAAAVYEAVVAKMEEPASQQALLSLALTYLDAGAAEASLEQARAYVEAAVAPADDARAHFVSARSLMELGRYDEAEAEYQSYLTLGGPAAPYASLGRAQALTLLGRGAEAVSDVEAALSADLPDGAQSLGILLVAQAYEQAGDAASAGQWYARLAQQAGSPEDQALAQWRLADIARGRGDPGWAVSARAVVAAYPQTAAALDALEALERADETIDAYRAGVALYRHFQDEDAVAVLRENLESAAPSHEAESWYYVAVAEERLGNNAAAIAAYESSVVADPGSDLADDAVWWRARLLESLGRLDEANAGYTELLLRYTSSPWTAEARFRRGLVAYKDAELEIAARTWEGLLTGVAAGEERARILVWLAKAEQRLGDDESAEAHLREAVTTAADAFYGLRAAALLDAEGDETSRVTFARTLDWAAADAWAASLGGAAPAFEPEADERWLRAAELRAVGLYERSDAELEELLAEHLASEADLYRLARAFDAAGETHLAARAATLLLDRLPAAEAEQAPAEVWRLAYPAGFASLVQTASRLEDVPADLLLALIRQESFFDPRAGSTAGALGLMQVIPSTGRAIADDLGEEAFEAEDLFRPSVSVRYGTHYIKGQLDGFEGDVLLALAAYNGGPGNALRWAEAADGDPDLFLEEIELPETRAYVELVSENLARYRALYATPSR